MIPSWFAGPRAGCCARAGSGPGQSPCTMCRASGGERGIERNDAPTGSRSDARVRTAGRDRGVHDSGAEVRMMSTLSTAAWAAHDVGLATAVGGTLYGRAALEPAL